VAVRESPVAPARLAKVLWLERRAGYASVINDVVIKPQSPGRVKHGAMTGGVRVRRHGDTAPVRAPPARA
jgi:hypothetical protein